MFELCNALVQVQGKPFIEVAKKNLTPGEVVLLRRIHGDASVLEIERAGTAERTDAEELDRLQMNYRESVVAEAYPGAAPVFPRTFQDIGINIGSNDPFTHKRKMIKEDNLDDEIKAAAARADDPMAGAEDPVDGDDSSDATEDGPAIDLSGIGGGENDEGGDDAPSETDDKPAPKKRGRPPKKAASA